MGSGARPSEPAPVNILVVDDVEDNLVATQALLVRSGLTVWLASCAAQALDLLGKHDMALALLDVQMPQVNGLELAERMRVGEHSRNVPIIFMTGDGSDPSRTFRGYEAGAVDFLVKPVDPHVLESKVGVFVELYRQRMQLRERNAELERLLQLNEAMSQELLKAHGRAIEEANTDALTGVSNRRHIFQLGEAALADRRQQAQPLSVAIFDLDHFKSINDTCGHHTGDAVLCGFCAHIVQQNRPSHRLGRIGGEEFLLLMPGTTLDEAGVILERLRRLLKPHAGVAYTFSAGMAQASACEGLQSVVKRADAALYGAKRAGRNCSMSSPGPL
jgi:diguanylate cyclase (GGDEF)-like protein